MRGGRGRRNSLPSAFFSRLSSLFLFCLFLSFLYLSSSIFFLQSCPVRSSGLFCNFISRRIRPYVVQIVFFYWPERMTGALELLLRLHFLVLWYQRQGETFRTFHSNVCNPMILFLMEGGLLGRRGNDILVRRDSSLKIQ